MQGRVDDRATEIVWKAYQTYGDGIVVDWVEPQDADKPATVTVVSPAETTSAHGHSTTASSSNDQGITEEQVRS